VRHRWLKEHARTGRYQRIAPPPRTLQAMEKVCSQLKPAQIRVAASTALLSAIRTFG